MTKLIQLLKPHLQQIKKSKRGRKAKAKPVKVNRRTELFYTRQLLEISKYCQEQSNEIILPEVGRNLGDSWLTDMLAKLRVKVENYIIGVAMPLATKVVIDVQKDVDQQIAEHTKAAIGVDLTPLYQASDIQSRVDYNIQTNVSLIKSIPKQYADKVEALVLNALQTGQTNEELAQEIKKLGHSTDIRARLIARDQMAKIQADINETRQRSLGVETYDYLTAQDDRVRPLCKSHHGKTFRWDTPPTGGHPGKKIGCRCTAVPNYEDILID